MYVCTVTYAQINSGIAVMFDDIRPFLVIIVIIAHLNIKQICAPAEIYT